MEIPQRKLNRLSEYDYGQEGAYFVTLCTQNRARLFQMELPVGNDLCVVPYNDLCVVPYNGLCAVPEGADDRNGTTRRSCPTEGNAIIHKWVRETERKFPNIAIDKYVIMPDHLHLIVTIKERHAGRSLRFYVHHDPFGRIIFNILPNLVVILLIANDMIIIGFLPQFAVKRR